LGLLVRDESNEALMMRFRDGDVRAFEFLLSRHQKPIYEFILRSVGSYNTALAEDLAQETFLRVVKQAKTYEQRAKFTTWLYTLARNLCIDNSRSIAPQEQVLLRETAMLLATPMPVLPPRT